MRNAEDVADGGNPEAGVGQAKGEPPAPQVRAALESERRVGASEERAAESDQLRQGTNVPVVAALPLAGDGSRVRAFWSAIARP